MFGIKTKKDRRFEELQTKVDYLEKVKLPSIIGETYQRKVKVLGTSIEVGSMSSIPEGCIKRDLAWRMADQLLNDGALELTKEVIPESGKTKYICKLKILDD